MFPEEVWLVDGGEGRPTRSPCDHPSMEEQTVWRLIERLHCEGISEDERVADLGEVLARRVGT